MRGRSKRTRHRQAGCRASGRAHARSASQRALRPRRRRPFPPARVLRCEGCCEQSSRSEVIQRWSSEASVSTNPSAQAATPPRAWPHGCAECRHACRPWVAWSRHGLPQAARRQHKAFASIPEQPGAVCRIELPQGVFAFSVVRAMQSTRIWRRVTHRWLVMSWYSALLMPATRLIGPGDKNIRSVRSTRLKPRVTRMPS